MERWAAVFQRSIRFRILFSSSFPVIKEGFVIVEVYRNSPTKERRSGSSSGMRSDKVVFPNKFVTSRHAK